ncbi:MAG: sigma 54-interacting transcriptional regulator [Gemmataceae bacterium]|nr:sigma 54-interacting transcriptional regulator [Gemmataceae bacterium]
MTRAQLALIAGEGTPSVLDLVPGTKVSLGRSSDNTIVVNDEHASRRHAEITQENGHWVVTNLGTPLNGTRVAGMRIGRPTVLEDGQEIGIGDTRFLFSLFENNGAKSTLTSRQPRDRIADSEASTLLLPDELTALCTFMAASMEETDARPLIRRALETVLKQTRATVTGFLSLDVDEPLPKQVLPEQEHMDVHLSRHLTQKVQRSGQPFWLASEIELGSDSLAPFTDALCLPVTAGGTALGALHVYRSGAVFTDRHQRFCAVLASYLANTLHVLRARRILEAENSRLRGHASASEQLLGSSTAMQALRERIARAAPRSATVLIRGDSGVGKELVALALHRQGPWSNGPLVVVNCAAIAASMPEAELFGHCKGAFTGADRDRPGLFQQADEGTLFLDEIGELPLDCQAKLLRVIEGKGFRPVGATAEVRVDVRVIAATNRNLENEVKNGAFRQDLYFRLQVIQITVPPLREHSDDIGDLAAHYLKQMGQEYRRQVTLTDAAIRRLQAYSWPGNVRQLWAVLESAATMTDSNVLDAEDLPLPPETLGPVAPTLNLDELEAWAIRQALQRTKGNVTQAARLLGVARDTLNNKMRKNGIRRDKP